MFKKKSFFNWDEIYISSNNDTTLAPIQSIDTGFEKKSLREKTDVLELKSYWKEKSTLIKFEAEKYLKTNLLGEIFFEPDIDLKSSYFQNNIHENETELRIKKIQDFYDKNFIDDVEILDIISVYLLEEKKIADLVSICNKFLNKNSLPLKFQFFLILAGVYKNNLQNIILSGDEKLIINILYKYKYLELNQNEKNLLYDIVISEKYPNLLGVIFYLFKNEFKGIRNIFPILQLISNDYHKLSKEEKRAFVQVYQNTNQYLKTYFLMKNHFSKIEVDTWIKKINIMNGKDKKFNQTIEEKLSGVAEKDKLIKKYQILKEAHNLAVLSPFEIILLLSSNKSLELIEGLNKFYETYPYSYSGNRAIAVLHFHHEDYKKFLLQISKAGNFKFQMEVLYLKAIAYREIGMNDESKKIFQALKNKFPDSEVLAKESGI